MWWKGLCIATCAWTLTGCSSFARPQVVTPPPAALAQPCPGPTLPADGTGREVLPAFVETIRALRECSDRHQALVRAWPQ